MKDIAGGRLLPEVDFWTMSTTREEVTIRGEGHMHRILGVHIIQEGFGTLGIPHNDGIFENEGEPGEGWKEERPVRKANIVRDR
jgi:hypothetical protein